MGYHLTKLENLVDRLKEVARKAFYWFNVLCLWQKLPIVKKVSKVGFEPLTFVSSRNLFWNSTSFCFDWEFGRVSSLVGMRPWRSFIGWDKIFEIFVTKILRFNENFIEISDNGPKSVQIKLELPPGIRGSCLIEGWWNGPVSKFNG